MYSLKLCAFVAYFWIITCLQFGLAQEKFTLLDTTNKDNGSVKEIRVERATTTPIATSASPTKVPYKRIQCPPGPIPITIFSLPCNHEKDCRVFGPNLACCKDRCVKGVLVSVAEKKTTQIPKTTTAKVFAPIAPVVSPKENAIVDNSKDVVTSNVSKVAKSSEGLVCPYQTTRLPLFSLPCNVNADCRVFGTKLLCCRDVCLEGVRPPKLEAAHAPALFGLVDRHCPAQPIAELLDVKPCEKDTDCLPRICCPEQNSQKSFCRTPVHNIERLPGAKRIQEPLRNFVSYMQCTPPPPRELFPKPCNNTLDCFPNLCCQENGRKFCRPPRRSLVALFADLTTRLGAVEATRKFIERITT